MLNSPEVSHEIPDFMTYHSFKGFGKISSQCHRSKSQIYQTQEKKFFINLISLVECVESM